MSDYKYGVYGELGASTAKAAAASSSTAVYIGTAPVNLIRGYANADIINKPVRIRSYSEAQSLIGIASDWSKYTLAEAIEAHFNNALGNIGPIYVINVLDPDTHRKATATTVQLAFTNGRAAIASEDIILDTLTLDNLAETTDYIVSYDFVNSKVNIISADSANPITGTVTTTYYEVDTDAVTYSDIIGSKTDAGVYKGLYAIDLLNQLHNVIPNLLAAPGWSDIPAVYRAMLTAVTKVNGHWDGFVLADIPISYVTYTYTVVSPGESENPHDLGYYVLQNGIYVLTEDTSPQSGTTYYIRTGTTTEVDTIAKAVAWKANNSYVNERSKVFYPQAMGTDGKVYHLSTLGVWAFLNADNGNGHNGVPFETCGNKAVPVAKQYFGASSTSNGFDEVDSRDLTKKGIATVIYHAAAWRLWGDSTAAYEYGSTEMDARAIFDVTIRVLFHITNGFQQRWGTTIDKPMTKQLKDTILTSEQMYLASLVTLGALIGNPTVSFLEEYNTESEILEGNFRWDFEVTPTPPLKSATAHVTYTSEGFSVYYD